MPHSPPIRLNIANTVTNLVRGDIQEHLPVERISLEGDVLGLGTTTSVDNGELTFLPSATGRTTELYKCPAVDGRPRRVHRGDGSSHFPYVCFTDDATDGARPIDISSLPRPGAGGIAELIAEAIERLHEPAPLYGMRLRAVWDELIITVASKLCMARRRRNEGLVTEEADDSSIYDTLQHYRLAETAPPEPSPIVYLGNQLTWECCGFYDMSPESGRVTVPDPTAPLHLHGASIDRAFGGHLQHQHTGSRLARLEGMVLYPIQEISHLASDLSVRNAEFARGNLSFEVHNEGELDVDDIGVDIVVDDRYSSRTYLRVPWLAAGAHERFEVPCTLQSGPHELLITVDPTENVIEPTSRRSNNSVQLTVRA